MNRFFILFVFLVVSSFVYSQPTLLKTIEYSGIITDIRFINDESIVISGWHRVKEYSLDKYDLLKEIEVGTEAIDFNSDFTLLATGTVPGITHLWDYNTIELLHTFEGHEQSRGPRDAFVGVVQWLDISNNDKYLVTGANDGKVILWDINTREKITHIESDFNFDTFERTRRTGSLVFSPEDKYLLVGSKLWNFPDLTLNAQLESSDSIFIDVGISGSKKYFYNNDRGLVRVWSLETKQKIKEFTFDDGIVDIDFSNDDNYIIANTFNGNVIIADFSTLEILLKFTQPVFIDPKFNNGFSDLSTDFIVRFHPNLDSFVVSGDEGNVYIYDLQEVLANQSIVTDWEGYE